MTSTTQTRREITQLSTAEASRLSEFGSFGPWRNGNVLIPGLAVTKETQYAIVQYQPDGHPVRAYIVNMDDGSIEIVIQFHYEGASGKTKFCYRFLHDVVAENPSVTFSFTRNLANGINPVNKKMWNNDYVPKINQFLEKHQLLENVEKAKFDEEC